MKTITIENKEYTIDELTLLVAEKQAEIANIDELKYAIQVKYNDELYNNVVSFIQPMVYKLGATEVQVFRTKIVLSLLKIVNSVIIEKYNVEIYTDTYFGDKSELVTPSNRLSNNSDNLDFQIKCLEFTSIIASNFKNLSGDILRILKAGDAAVEDYSKNIYKLENFIKIAKIEIGKLQYEKMENEITPKIVIGANFKFHSNFFYVNGKGGDTISELTIKQITDKNVIIDCYYGNKRIEKNEFNSMLISSINKENELKAKYDLLKSAEFISMDTNAYGFERGKKYFKIKSFTEFGSVILENDEQVSFEKMLNCEIFTK